MPKPDRKRPATPLESSPHPRWGMIGLWLALILVVLVTVANLMPGGGAGNPLTLRREKRQMKTAADMEAERLWRAAAEVYQGLAQDNRISNKTRSEASERLAELYREELSDHSAAEAALEKAYFFAPSSERKSQLKERLEQLQKESGSGWTSDTASPPLGTTAIAKVGANSITLEEILNAWRAIHQDQQATPEQFEQFVQDYMTQALLAEEGRRRKEDKAPGYAMQMRFHDQQFLAQTVLRSLLPKPDKEETRRYYDQNIQKFSRPAGFNAEHLVVQTEKEAKDAGDRMSRGEAFEKVAREISLDKGSLPEGSQLGWIGEDEDFIPHLGSVPSLAKRLVQYDDGTTTGPIQTARGFHWIKVVGHRSAEPYPFEQVQDKADAASRKQKFDEARVKLLQDLKKSIPVTIYEEVLKQAIKEGRQSGGEGKNQNEKPNSTASPP